MISGNMVQYMPIAASGPPDYRRREKFDLCQNRSVAFPDCIIIALEVGPMLPSDLLFTKQHEWVRVSGIRATIGITGYAQEQLGDVVFVDLPTVGDKISAGATLATVESVKAVSDIYAPISGEVLSTNDDLEHSPEFVNQDPYGKGWIAVVELSESDQLAGLLSPQDYEPLINK